MTRSAKRDIYQDVTDRIIGELEQGAAPWVKPWTTTASAHIPHNAATGHEYRGVNILMLWMQTCMRDYETAGFVTFRQAKATGGHVRKGEKGAKVVLYKDVVKEVDGEEQSFPMLKQYTVFNVDQCDDLPESFHADPGPAPVLLPAPGDRFQAFVTATGATVRHHGNRAFYTSGADMIQLPRATDFQSSEVYKATLLHELVHWSGAKHRLDRDLANRFGSHAYAAEELVAELGAAFLCAHLGIAGDLRHAGYIDHWLDLMRSDKKAIFTAASKASKAADYLRSFSEAEAIAEAA